MKRQYERVETRENHNAEILKHVRKFVEIQKNDRAREEKGCYEITTWQIKVKFLCPVDIFHSI